MSAKWMGYYFDETPLKGSQLLVILAIADHADADGVAFPGIESLCKKVKLKTRQVQKLLRQLEADGWIETYHDKGRGNLKMFQCKKVHSSTPITEDKRCTPATEKVHSDDIKGVLSQQEKVYSGNIPIYKDEPLKNLVNQKENQEPNFRYSKNVTLPDDFHVTSRMRTWAESKGLEHLEFQTERFRNHALANGRKCKDWISAWYNWMTSPYKKDPVKQALSDYPTVDEIEAARAKYEDVSKLPQPPR